MLNGPYFFEPVGTVGGTIQFHLRSSIVINNLVLFFNVIEGLRPSPQPFLLLEHIVDKSSSNANHTNNLAIQNFFLMISCALGKLFLKIVNS